MINLLLSADWIFGINELISTISAVLTFLAICTSLYLAQKSKTLKFKILQRKIVNKYFIENQFQEILILNCGYTKFTVSKIGYKIGRYFFMTDIILGTRNLDQTRVEKDTNGSKTEIGFEKILLSTYVQEGDMLKIALYPADYDFTEIKNNYKVFVFIEVNGKLHKYYTGIKFFEFKDLISTFKRKSLCNQSGNKYKGKEF